MADFFNKFVFQGEGGGVGSPKKLTSFDFQWACVTCYNGGPQISNKIRVGHGHLTYTSVTCFKAFKNAFKKVRNNVMEKNKYLEVNIVTLIEWVDKWVVKALQQSLKKYNTKS
jgi:hypothetical protein